MNEIVYLPLKYKTSLCANNKIHCATCGCHSNATEFFDNDKLSKAQKDPNYQYEITGDEL